MLLPFDDGVLSATESRGGAGDHGIADHVLHDGAQPGRGQQDAGAGASVQGRKALKCITGWMHRVRSQRFGICGEGVCAQSSAGPR